MEQRHRLCLQPTITLLPHLMQQGPRSGPMWQITGHVIEFIPTFLYNCGLEQAPEQHLVENMINTGITSGIQQQTTTHAPRPGSFLCVESQESCFGTHQ